MEKSPMNARLVASPRRSTHSGSIAYVRINAPPHLAIAIENPPPAPPRQLKSSRHDLASKNALVTPLSSALAQVQIPQNLKSSRINTYAKTGCSSVLLLTAFPKRSDEPAPPSPPLQVRSLHHYFFTSLLRLSRPASPLPRGEPIFHLILTIKRKEAYRSS